MPHTRVGLHLESLPRDLPLPLPASAPFLEALLTLAFVAHLLFVNLMVGSSLLVLGLEIAGRRDRSAQALARALAATVTVNKSLAVVLGVAPLLAINVLYTTHFYTANALTGAAWILLVPLIAAAFLLLYVHKYTQERWAARPGRRLAVLAAATAVLVFVPLVFLVNVTLMMLPAAWTQVAGFWSALALPGVLPRYLHFLDASLVLSSLFAIGYLGRAGARVPDGLDPRRARRALYTVALVASLAQYVAGPLVLLALPSAGLSAHALWSIAIGATLSVPAVALIWRERRAAVGDRRALIAIVALLSTAAICMAIGRHTVRLHLLAGHRAAIATTTEVWQRDVAMAARDRRDQAAGIRPGQRLFDETCAACHGVDHRVVGPPLTEIAALYRGQPDGIVRWATAPGKKRDGYPQMPAFASLGDERLRAIADYMLDAGAAATRR